MAVQPVIHLTSAAQAIAWRHKGGISGPQLHIMATPNAAHGERGVGYVDILRPTHKEWSVGHGIVIDRREGREPDPVALARYRGSMEARWGVALEAGALAPGVMAFVAYSGNSGAVPSGAVLTCACGNGKECHRLWAAPFLARAGWDVVVDGARAGLFG